MATLDDEQIVKHVIANKDNYYSVLNIPKAATEEEIKRAYKKMALKLHPDKNKHPKAEEAFKHVSAAHTTLADKEKRRIYDRHGKDGVQAHESSGGGFGGMQNPFAAAGGAQNVNFDDFIQEILKQFGNPGMNSAENFNQQEQPDFFERRKRKNGGAKVSSSGGIWQFILILVVMFLSISFIIVVSVLKKIGSFFFQPSSSSSGGRKRKP